MTRREVILLFALAVTLVWRVLWSVDRAINPVTEPQPLRRAERKIPLPPSAEAPTPRQPVNTHSPRAPLSPFLWVRSPPRPWGPPAVASPAPEPEPEPEWVAESPEIRLPGWLFEPPPMPRPPVWVADAEETYLDEEPEWIEDEGTAEEPVQEFVEPPAPQLQSEVMLQPYGPILDSLGVAPYGVWMPRVGVGYPLWIWSEGLNYMPGYAPHHHHDSWFEFRLRIRH
jgi:hypothetical protein